MQRRVVRLAPTGAGVSGPARSPALRLSRQIPRRIFGRPSVEPERARPPWPVLLLLVSLPLPWQFSIGPFTLAPYRLVLLAMVIPCLARWMSGKAGRIRLSDIAVIVYVGWCALSMCVIHGVSYALQPAGMMFVETVGGYFLGRCYVRNAQDLKAVARWLFLIVAVLLPFAAAEALSGHNVFKDTLARLLPSYVDVDMEPRWGLKRVQAGFQHPILFGVFCGCVLSLVHLVLGHGEPAWRRWLRTGTVVATAFLSLSAGPLSGVAGQAMLLGWGWVLRGVRAKWTLLMTGAGFCALAIELVANRSLPVIFISTFAFDESSAYIRILIWRFGWESIANHPLFGVGFGEWDRPAWMPASIDMNWIIDTVRHGLPAGILLMITFFSAVIGVGRKKGLDEEQNLYRTAYVVTMTGFFVVGWTVYIWTSVNALMFFLLASGLWLADIDGQPAGRWPYAGRRAVRLPDEPSIHSHRPYPQRLPVG